MLFEFNCCVLNKLSKNSNRHLEKAKNKFVHPLGHTAAKTRHDYTSTYIYNLLIGVVNSLNIENQYISVSWQTVIKTFNGMECMCDIVL